MTNNFRKSQLTDFSWFTAELIWLGFTKTGVFVIAAKDERRQPWRWLLVWEEEKRERGEGEYNLKALHEVS